MTKRVMMVSVDTADRQYTVADPAFISRPKTFSAYAARVVCPGCGNYVTTSTDGTYTEHAARTGELILTQADRYHQSVCFKSGKPVIYEPAHA